MATFISLCSFTEQGSRAIQESPQRAEAFKATAEKMGVTVRELCWTVGAYDLVIVCEGREEAVHAALLKVASLGNVRSETLRGYSAAEFSKLIAID